MQTKFSFQVSFQNGTKHRQKVELQSCLTDRMPNYIIIYTCTCKQFSVRHLIQTLPLHSFQTMDCESVSLRKRP